MEATAGNTGVGLALIGVNRGYKVKLFVPEGFAEEKCILMRGFGAEVVRTPEAEGMAGAIREDQQAGGRFQGRSWQGSLRTRPIRSFTTTRRRRRLWDQMEGRVDGFVAGVGTGGTFSGVAQFLKEKNPARHYDCGGNAGIDSAGRRAGQASRGRHWRCFVPETFHRDVCDRVVMVTDDDAFAMVKRLAAEEGVLGGSSAGAAVYAALELARELGPGKRVATIIPDSAERYLSKKIFEGGI